MEMTCEGCLNAAKRVLAKIGGMDNMYMYMSMVIILAAKILYFISDVVQCNTKIL